MKKILGFPVIIIITALVVFSLTSCLTLGGREENNRDISSQAHLAAVPPGNVPASIVAVWYDDARKRSGDFAHMITSDGKIIVYGGDASTLYANDTHIWLIHPQGGEMSWEHRRGERTAYRLAGNSMFITVTFMGQTGEIEFFR